MNDRWKVVSILFGILFLVFLLLFIPGVVVASRLPDNPLPPPVLPEPYPNSNIYPAQVYLATQDDLQILYRLDIDVEGLVTSNGTPPTREKSFKPLLATVYIDPLQADLLKAAGLSMVPIPNEGYRSFLASGPGSGAPDAWPTYEEYVTRMQNLENTYPDIVKLFDIGDSVLGRDLLCMEITTTPGADENKPEFKYTANHHGDETTGVEMILRLAELLAFSYGSDPILTSMVEKIEIWLCPIYNPDGYVAGTRNNAHDVNLNRDFPDRFIDPIDDPAGREPETQAFMNFEYNHRFVMGANYHGGAQVLNYPWDAVARPGDPIIPSYAPDDQLFFDFGMGYTTRNPNLWYGGWPNGMTRGWEWYQVWGGMQDWAYYYHGEHHVTLEISNVKSPLFDQMDTYWENNRDAMLWWIQRTWTGLGGLVYDARDSTPLDATITLVGMDTPNTILTDPGAGDYHRVISEGNYTLNTSASGYMEQIADVSVVSGTVTSHDFYLCPEDPQIVSGTITDETTGLPLQAFIEFLGSRQVTTSDPEDGSYSIQICPFTYTMSVSARWYYPEERLVTIDQSQIQNFALLPSPNLSPSNKMASVDHPLPLDEVQYQLNVINAGVTATVSVTDTLPISITWTGDLTATQGIPIFDDGKIFWQGEVSQNHPVTITYSASLTQCLPADSTILNIAEFNDGVNPIMTGKALLSVANANPSMPESPSPTDGAINQSVTTNLVWAPSTDLNCDALTYDLAFGTTPTPTITAIDLSNPYFDPGVLLPGRTYYWYVISKDGITQITGPTWSFSTLQFGALLPLIIK